VGAVREANRVVINDEAGAAKIELVGHEAASRPARARLERIEFIRARIPWLLSRAESF
jgi:hypothetical protein